MSLHKDLMALAHRLQHEEPEVDAPGYRDGLFDASDFILEILDKYPLKTGHEWEVIACFWNETDQTPDMRQICKLCGMDREFGDEAEMCDNRRPGSEKSEDVDDAS